MAIASSAGPGEGETEGLRSVQKDSCTVSCSHLFDPAPQLGTDLMIALTAFTHKAVLLTQDQDFQIYRNEFGLTVE